VVDGNGILGQVARVGPWSAEVILVTDPEHAIPVEVTRNGLRSIAVGSGNSGELLLPYLAINSDVKSGDLLVSSGLGGVFPAGLSGRDASPACGARAIRCWHRCARSRWPPSSAIAKSCC
jgi:rod shape-determining protein MreC